MADALLQIDDEPALVRAIFKGDVDTVWNILDEEDLESIKNIMDIDKRTPLHACAYLGRSDMADLLLKAGAETNARDSRSLTPLHRACRSGSANVVSLLITYGADVNARDINWQTPAHVAAAHNAVECMNTMLIPSCISLNVEDKIGRTELHYAAYTGHYDMVELLLNYGASVNAMDRQSRRPIHWASYEGHEAVVRLLIQQNAEIDVQDTNGFSPLHAAAANGHAFVAKMLVEEGASVDMVTKIGNLPLHTACLKGKTSVVQYLLKYEYDEDELCNDQLQSPLHLAATASMSKQCLGMISNSYSYMAKMQDKEGRTPLHMASIYGNIDGVFELLKESDINDVDFSGQSPAHKAAEKGFDSVLQILIKNGINVSILDLKGQSPLHMAAASGSYQCVKALVEAGADVNVQDDDGLSPLHILSSKRNLECLNYLIKEGAVVNQSDINERHPLHYAVIESDHSFVEALVDSGGEVNKRDKFGDTPLFLASSVSIVEYLMNKGADPCLDDETGGSIIHRSATLGNSEVLVYFVKIFPDSLPSRFESALHCAAKSGLIECIIPLIFRIPSIDPVDESGRTALAIAALNGHEEVVSFLLENNFASSVSFPVHYAAHEGHLSCLNLLMKYKDKINCDKDLESKTPLMLASKNGKLDCVKLLLEGFKVPVDDEDDIARTALFYAIEEGHREIVLCLAEHGADSLRRDKNGKTSFHIAAESSNAFCLLILLERLEESKLQELMEKHEFKFSMRDSWKKKMECVEHLIKAVEHFKI